TVNLMIGGVVANTLKGQSAGTLTFGSNIPVAGSDTFNVVATDTGTSSAFVFNSVGNTITVNTAPTLTLPLASNTVIDSGQSVTFNTILAGGTGPFTVNLVNGGV